VPDMLLEWGEKCIPLRFWCRNLLEDREGRTNMAHSDMDA
jgi:hypothetical protein